MNIARVRVNCLYMHPVYFGLYKSTVAIGKGM